MMSQARLRKIMFIAAGSVLLAAGGAAAGAAITAGPVSGGVISACYKSTAASNGSHAVVLENTGTKCASGYTGVTWNQKGQAGPPGVANVDRGVVQWTGGGYPGPTCTLEQVAGPDAASISVLSGPSVPANFCPIQGLPSGSIVTVTPIGPIGSVGAQVYGWSDDTLDVNTSGSQGEYAFTAFPGS